jgi:hypothetical protein
MNETDIVCTPVADAIGKNVDWGVRKVLLHKVHWTIDSPIEITVVALDEEVADERGW